MSMFFPTYNSLHMTLFSKYLPEWNMPNLCQKELSNFTSMVLFSPRIVDFLNQHITPPIIGLTSQQNLQLDPLCYPFWYPTLQTPKNVAAKHASFFFKKKHGTPVTKKAAGIFST